jgi:hypothetical protein
MVVVDVDTAATVEGAPAPPASDPAVGAEPPDAEPEGSNGATVAGRFGTSI